MEKYDARANEFKYLEERQLIQIRPFYLESLKNISGTWQLSTYKFNPMLTRNQRSNQYIGLTFVINSDQITSASLNNKFKNDENDKCILNYMSELVNFQQVAKNQNILFPDFKERIPTKLSNGQL